MKAIFYRKIEPVGQSPILIPDSFRDAKRFYDRIWSIGGTNALFVVALP